MSVPKIDYTTIAAIVGITVVAGGATLKAIDKVFGAIIDRRLGRKNNKNGNNRPSAPVPQAQQLDRIEGAVVDSDHVPVSTKVKWLAEQHDRQDKILSDITRHLERANEIQQRILDKLDART